MPAGTFSEMPKAQAPRAKPMPAATPAKPRACKGDTSASSNFSMGQLLPQPQAVATSRTMPAVLTR
jgi:hypothetical protein